MGALDPSLLLYPAYFCLGNGALAVLIARRRVVLDRRAAAFPHPAHTMRLEAS